MEARGKHGGGGYARSGAQERAWGRCCFRRDLKGQEAASKWRSRRRALRAEGAVCRRAKAAQCGWGLACGRERTLVRGAQGCAGLQDIQGEWLILYSMWVGSQRTLHWEDVCNEPHVPGCHVVSGSSGALGEARRYYCSTSTERSNGSSGNGDMFMFIAAIYI